MPMPNIVKTEKIRLRIKVPTKKKSVTVKSGLECLRNLRIMALYSTGSGLFA